MENSIIRGGMIALILTSGLACADRPRETAWQGKMATADGIKTFERTDDGKSLYYDVFDRDGRGLVKLPIPESTRPQVWKGGRMYAIKENAEGRQSVSRYQLIWRLAISARE